MEPTRNNLSSSPWGNPYPNQGPPAAGRGQPPNAGQGAPSASPQLAQLQGGWPPAGQHPSSQPGYPPPGYPPPGYPPPGYPPAGYPPAGYPPAGYPPAGYRPAVYVPTIPRSQSVPPPGALDPRLLSQFPRDMLVRALVGRNNPNEHASYRQSPRPPSRNSQATGSNHPSQYSNTSHSARREPTPLFEESDDDEYLPHASDISSRTGPSTSGAGPSRGPTRTAKQGKERSAPYPSSESSAATVSCSPCRHPKAPHEANRVPNEDNHFSGCTVTDNELQSNDPKVQTRAYNRTRKRNSIVNKAIRGGRTSTRGVRRDEKNDFLKRNGFESGAEYENFLAKQNGHDSAAEHKQAKRDERAAADGKTRQKYLKDQRDRVAVETLGPGNDRKDLERHQWTQRARRQLGPAATPQDLKALQRQERNIARSIGVPPSALRFRMETPPLPDLAPPPPPRRTPSPGSGGGMAQRLRVQDN
ncbi:hypothetical protein GWC77_27160 [Paraburkholderia sp. NMBU_R16]|nr:hypothetical protein [Paraburkholderia sp. NMBU_R16]